MDQWQFQYHKLITCINEFAGEHGDEDFTLAWDYTQKMVKAHGLAIRPNEISDDQAIAIAWSQFEDTFDDESEEAIVSLAGIIANLVTAVPVGKNEEFHMALEVGFACARGFSREDAIRQHQQWQEENQAFFNNEPLIEEEASPEFAPNELRSMFRLVPGGQEDEHDY